MKRKFKKILSLLMSVVILTGTFIFTGQAEDVTEDVTNNNNASNYSTTITATSVPDSGSDESDDKLSILHMDRTVTENPDGGFDVELSSYLDGVIKSETAEKKQALDVVFVLDGSGSVFDATGDRSQVYQIVDSILNALQILKDDGGNHRVGFVTFATAIKQRGTTKSLISINEALLPETNEDAQYSPSIFSASRYVGNKYLKYYCESTNALGGATYTHLATEEAKTLLKKSKSSDHTQICIVITDGIPSATFEFNELFANNAIEDASEMKANGVTIYAIKAFIRVSDGYVSRMNRFFRRLSSCYDSTAINMDNECEQKFEDDNYISEASNSETLVSSLYKILKKTSQEIITKWLYPLVLDSNSITQDVISPYFKLSGTPTYEIQTAKFNTDGSHNKSNWTSSTVKNANVDRQRVYVDDFNYIDHCVAYLNKENSARLVIKYHIDPIENFFGGNSVPTNVPCTADDGTENVDYLTNGSGIYCDGDFFMDFEDVGVNIPLNPGAVKFNSIDNAPFLSTQVPDNQVEITKFDETYFDGINNAYVDVEIYGAANNRDINRSDSNNILKQAAKSKFQYNKYLSGEFEDVSLFKSDGYIVEQNEDFYIYTKVTPSATADITQTVGPAVQAIHSTTSGYIDTTAAYKLKFIYTYDSVTLTINKNTVNEETITVTPNELKNVNTDEIIKAPECNQTFSSIDDINQYIANLNKSQRGYYKYETPNETIKCNYLFGKFVSDVTNPMFDKRVEREDKDGVRTYTLYANWKYDGVDTSVKTTDFTVEAYFMNPDGSYSSYPSYTYDASTLIGNKVSLGYYNGTDPESGVFAIDSNGTLNDVSSVINENPANYNHAYSATVNGVAKNNFRAYRVEYSDSNNTKTQSDTLAYTVNYLICPYCARLIKDGNTNENDLYYCCNCNKYVPETRYSDFELDTNNDNYMGSITAVENAGENIIKLYFKRAQHSIKVNVTNKEISETPKTYTLTGYYGQSISDIFEKNNQYMSVVYAEDGVTPIEKVKYFTVEKSNYIYFGDSRTPHKESDSYVYVVNTSDIFETYAMYNNKIPAHDVYNEITLTPQYSNLTVAKSYKPTDTQKSNCVFSIYEINGVNTPKYMFSFTMKSGRKIIKNLRVGKAYAVVEESWSYKLTPKKRVVLIQIKNNSLVSFPNSPSNISISGSTSDKIVVNRYDNNNKTIVTS